MVLGTGRMNGHVGSQRTCGHYQIIVTQKFMVSEDVAAFRLSGLNNTALPPFTAGAHIDVHVAPDAIRQYSLCNAPNEDDGYLIAVKREAASRGGSKRMHDEVQIGDSLWISSPRNNFPLSSQGEHSLLIAGGIGITPILSMARQLHRDGRSFEVDYFARSREQMAFGDLLEQVDWADRVRFHFGLDRTGTINRLKTRLLRRPNDAHLYMCGPYALMESVTDIASRKWPSASIHREFFAPPQSLHSPDDEQFTVVLAKRNMEIVVPSGRSIMDALNEAGIPLDTSCRQGTCGTCITEVLEGKVDHRDSILSSDERESGKYMIPCVSRAKGIRIVLNL